MLLEAYQLLANRIGQGFATNQSHEHFSTNMSHGYTSWRLILNLDGSIYKIEPMGKEEAPGFWSLEEGTSAKAKRFPALRPKFPLLQLDVASPVWEILKKLTDSNIDEIKSQLIVLATEQPKNPQDFHDAWVFKAKPILLWETNADNKLLLHLQQCVTAFGIFCGVDKNKHECKQEIKSIFTNNAAIVANSLASAFIVLLQNATQKDQIKAIAASLFGIRKAKNGKYEIEAKTQLCVDLHLPDAFGSTIYTPLMAKMALAFLGKDSSGNDPLGICAISGEKGPLLKIKLPDWDSPLFKTPPYSKFRDAPCNQRYGRFGLDGFDISSNLARSLVGELQKMTATRFEWKTWVKLHNGKFKKQSGKKPMPLKDLMLAYPSFDIEDLITIDVFTHRRAEKEDENEAARQAKQFIDCAELLCRALKEKINTESDETEYMRIMLVRSVSQGQIQLSYAAAPTVKDFIFALQAWSLSENNLPQNLRVPLPYKKSTTDFRWRKPRLLFPEQIGQLLTLTWIRDGNEATNIQGPSVGMVFDLFLRKSGVWQETAQCLLEITLERAEALLVGAGHVLHREKRDASEPWRLWRSFIAKAQSGKEKRRPDYALAQTLSLIGSLLYAMNSNVQDYMNESAYLIGKLLAMMDELHKCYCIAVRQGDIPNALIGNGLLGRAAESPTLALEELAERSRIYLGWAKTAQINATTDEQEKIAVNSARKLLRLAHPLAERLHADQALENELSAVAKAHLFLGYLSPVLGGDGHSDSTDDDSVNTDAADKN